MMLLPHLLNIFSLKEFRKVQLFWSKYKSIQFIHSLRLIMKLKRWSILLGTITLVSVPVLFDTPVRASLQQATEAIVEAINRPEVKLILTADKKVEEVDAEGNKKIVWQGLEDGAEVLPGDSLRYTIQSENEGDLAAKKLVITQPIPEQMVYHLDSATSTANTDITYSIDGGETFVTEPMVEKTLEDGTVVEVPAPAELYTHVRWQFSGDLSAQKDASASYEVQVK
jgi:uncharacterized repeat protein (TIGR01451 family)